MRRYTEPDTAEGRWRTHGRSAGPVCTRGDTQAMALPECGRAPEHARTSRPQYSHALLRGVLARPALVLPPFRSATRIR